MAINVETGNGSSSSESYASVSDADTYHASFTPGTVWSSAALSDKERALRIATQHIDTSYRFLGLRTFDVQALQWPRTEVYDLDDKLISDRSIPKLIIQATCELALRALSGSLVTDINQGSIKSTSVKVGPLSESIEYVGGQSQQKTFTIVDNMIRQFTGSSVLERS